MEHEFIDDYNTFDSITCVIAGIFIILNVNYALTEPDMRFTSLTQEYLYFVV